jgi:hypothetical protein
MLSSKRKVKRQDYPTKLVRKPKQSTCRNMSGLKNA